MHADEVEVDDDVVRHLLSAQCPAWADRALRRVPDAGTDNAIYRLGDDLGLRLPRIHWAVDQIEKEWRWLGRLAPHLPAAVPVPLFKGDPGHGYPYPWLVYPWVNGTSLDRATIRGLDTLVSDVAAFVVALRGVPAGDGPAPRRRGGPMAPRDREVRWALAELGDLVDTGRALRVREAALEAGPWTDAPLWVHGDLLPGNIVVRDGRLRGVIDWSGAGVGDPACDAMLGWSLPSGARGAFRDAAGFDDANVGPGSGVGGGADGPLHPVLRGDAAPCGRPGGAALAGRARGLSEPARGPGSPPPPASVSCAHAARTRRRTRRSRVRGPGCDTRQDRGMTTSFRPCHPCHPYRPPWRRPRRRGRPSRACRPRGPRS